MRYPATLRLQNLSTYLYYQKHLPMSTFFAEKKIIHVGDNPVTDIQMGKEKGLETYHYENVSSKGKKYRTSFFIQ